MENKANYFFVGLFVFGVFFASLGIMLWLGDYGEKKEIFDYYEIYTEESVSGLSIKSPVRLLGVEVGNVEKIDFFTNEGLKIKILIKVKENIPVKEDTYASLETTGITGLKYIQLQGGTRESNMLTSVSGALPVIKMKDSFFKKLDAQGEHVFSLIKKTEEASKQLLSDKNLKNIEILLYNIAEFSQNLNAHSKDLSKNLTTLSAKFIVMSDNISALSKKLQTSLDSVDKGINSINEFTTKASKKLDSYDSIRYSLTQDLELLKNVLQNANSLLMQLQKSPSNLIFKETKTKLAPGEE
ncbi:MCE family protein [Campylobacter sp. LR291e]|uniref:MlaD family protein n=1 Tax=unclassified Campylobacter TaxID=2593542 RepID=UPI00123A7240|nr:MULTISPECIES: MlaD family protein [unclassified Campylobacter]KAA6228236.1 MCE family protein [Campylobacter sp. LR196d]KAA6229236.1 MCE family protein [Campylobacter sp. LR291e]